MADTKVTALTADTSPATTDLAYFVKDPAGTPLSRKITLANLSKGIDHDQTVNFASNEHIDHSGVSVTAGDGLSGGGTIAATRTIDVDITNTADKAAPVAADELLLADSQDTAAIKKADLASLSAGIDHDATANFVANEHIDHSGVTITAGAGMTGGGTIEATRTLNVIAGDGIAVAADAVAVDITNAADKGTPVAADELLIGDSAAAGAIKKADAQSVIDGTTALTEGKFTIWVPANAMTPATTSGPATGQLESSSNKVNIETLDFDTGADEFAHFSLAMPKSWNAGTVTFQVFWSTTNASTGTMAWALQAVAFANSNPLDAAYGTAVVVTDAAETAALDMLVTDVSAAVTIAGSPGDDELVNFRFFRDVSGDAAAEDALLLGIKLFVTIDLANDD